MCSATGVILWAFLVLVLMVMIPLLFGLGSRLISKENPYDPNDQDWDGAYFGWNGLIKRFKDRK